MKSRLEDMLTTSLAWLVVLAMMVVVMLSAFGFMDAMIFDECYFRGERARTNTQYYNVINGASCWVKNLNKR